MAFTKKHANVYIQDGSGSAIATMSDVGDVNISNLQENDAEAVAIRNRGSFAGFVEGDDQEVAISFSVRVDRATFTSGAAFRPLDLFRSTGDAGGNTSDNAISTGPTAYRLKYEATDGTATGSITLGQVRFTCSLDESGETAMWQVSATALEVLAVA